MTDMAFETSIPRLVHQICLGGTLPETVRRNVDELKSRNPGWEHRLYDDAAAERCIAEHYGAAMLRRWRRIAPEYAAARADLFRYLVLYRAGGVYIDLKSRFTRPIDEVIRGDEGFILSRWRNGAGQPHEGWGLHADLAGLPGGEIQQWHVIAAPGHPFLRAVIERVVRNIDRYSVRGAGVGWIGVLRITGPIAYTLAITPLLDRYACRVIADESVLGLEYSVLDSSSHQGLFTRHYTQNTSPVVRRPGLAGWRDRTYLRARAIKRRLLA